MESTMFPKPRLISDGEMEKKYVTVSERMADYKGLLNSDAEYSALEAAYGAYIAALNNEKYDEVRGSSGQ